MKKHFITGALTLAAAALSAATLDIVPAEFKIYKVGEPVTFKVTAKCDKGKLMTAGTFAVKVTDSGKTPIGKPVQIDLAKGNPTSFTVKLDRPGFILAAATNCTLRDNKTIKWSRKGFAPLAGAAVEPEKIKAGAERPADFNKFWQDGVKAYKNAEVIVTPAPELAKIIEPVKNLKERLAGYNFYRVESKFADKSGSITGFLVVPAAPGKYPIIAGVPGAGPGTIYPGASYFSGKPAIQLFMNVHPYPTASTGAEQKKRYNEYNKSLQTPQGIKRIYTMYKADNRDEYIYRKVWLALNRALEHVMTMKEFDGKNIAAVGSSQGGGSALALAGINSKVTCVVANVPALCDHGGWKAGRAPGWPRLHNNWKGKADAAAAYFDGANFAMNIKAPALVSVGYIDVTCSPSSVYAAYNNLAGKKSIYPMYRLGHTATADFSPAASKFLDEQFFGK